jgi:hypothetical protein
MPISHFFYYYLKKKKKKYARVAGHPSIFLFFFFFFFFLIFCDRGILERKNVKVVELPQFESLEGGKVSHLKLWR